MLFMEYIDGVDASRVKISDPKEKARLADEIVDNLLSLHSVSNPCGFGDFVAENYSDSWEKYYKQQIGSIYSALKKKKPFMLSSASMDLADRLFDSYDRVFQNPVRENSLIHGDYNLWNLMVDPKSNRLIGMIDPMGCCYADRELDLFQLENSNGNEYGLLKNYSQKVPLSPNLSLKTLITAFGTI